MQKIELRCEICSQKFDVNYNIPKVLNCGHTVCSKCVDKMRDKNISKCPFDRKVLDFDDNSIAINYYILSLIDNSVKDAPLNQLSTEDEILELNPRPVINSPGWKNTLDGFIRNDILYTVETNGFIYCTDLNTGEWWFMYHNQFFGNFIFENPNDSKMYLIDQYGSLFQIFNKNYYVQIGKKNSWRNTTHMAVLNNKLYSLESSNKLYETNLINGKWKEVVISKNKMKSENKEASDEKNVRNSIERNERNERNSLHRNSNSNPNFFSKSANSNYRIDEENENKLFKNVNMLIQTKNCIMFSNKNGELFSYNDNTGEIKNARKDFFKDIESYSSNKTHVYFFEKKNSKIIYRAKIIESNCNTNVNINEKLLNSWNSYNSFKSDSNKFSNTNDLELNYEVKLKNNQEKENKNNLTNLQSNDTEFFLPEIFINLDIEKILSITNGINITPLKIIVNDIKIVIIDKVGDIYVFSIETKKLLNNYQCLFMLRNCHLTNTALMGDGDLLLLDPIRLSLNKLNIICGTEVIVLHSIKFLYTIKHIFSANSRIYFIDTSGNLYFFNEIDKKLTQIGNNSICKYILDFAVYKNNILTIENNTLFKTNLNDGNYIEVKNEMCKNYDQFFADSANIIFITKDDEIHVSSLGSSSISNKDESILKLKKTIKFRDISKSSAMAYFRNHIIFYNSDKKTIEALSIEDHSHKICVDNFPDVNMFINNRDILSCVTRDGVIYKLYC